MRWWLVIHLRGPIDPPLEVLVKVEQRDEPAALLRDDLVRWVGVRSRDAARAREVADRLALPAGYTARVVSSRNLAR